MTVDEKVELLNKFIDDIKYPNKNAPAKKLLKDKVTSIKNENSTKNDDKLKKLDKLKNTLEQIKTKLANVIKEIDDLPYPDKPTLKKGDEVNAKDKFKGKLDNLIDAKRLRKYYQLIEKIKLKNIMKSLNY
ncbi:hypothetical protein NWP96_03395 [Mycoplasmopsis cynos]|nr:hypothetical protein [Mycoplasmopsis cynos]